MFNFNIDGTEYSIPIVNNGEQKFISFNYFCLIALNFNTPNISKELRNVSKKNYYKERNGRSVVTYINGNGLCEFLTKTIRFSHSEKNEFLNELKKHKMIGENIVLMQTRKELEFYDILVIFLKEFGKNIKKQINIDGYIVDFVIDNNFIVEFDEDNHIQYDKSKELKRDDYLKSKGYKVIRVNDRVSNIKNLAIVFKEI